MTTHDPKLLQELKGDRAARLASRLTLNQREAIANDTRPPGEIAGAYGVTAAVIVQIQHKARFSESQKKAAARRKLRQLGDNNSRPVIYASYQHKEENTVE
jgi:hypothetical protein